MYPEFNYYENRRAQYKEEYFDSTTEAAWAVYFDSVEMPYIREPETFKFVFDHNKLLPILYTPDFYLPDQDTYVEVKNGNINTKAITKIHLLSKATGRAALLLAGKPHYGMINVYGPDSCTDPSRRYPQNADLRVSVSCLTVGDKQTSYTRDKIMNAVSQSKTQWSLNVNPDIEEKALLRRKALNENPTVHHIH